ncbi:MAG: FAD:protein FMN transferase [Planctomycetota bacterium]
MGFGPGRDQVADPTDAELNAARAALGFDDIRVDPDANTLTRTREDIELDLSAIAKGLAVDKVIETLLDAGVTDALVEVGGEVRTAGHRPGGEPWRLAVKAPSPTIPSWVALVTLENRSLATSGDYRNFRVLADGSTVSHTSIRAPAVRWFPHRQRFGAGPHLRRGDAWATALACSGPPACTDRSAPRAGSPHGSCTPPPAPTTVQSTQGWPAPASHEPGGWLLPLLSFTSARPDFPGPRAVT